MVCDLRPQTFHRGWMVWWSKPRDPEMREVRPQGGSTYGGKLPLPRTRLGFHPVVLHSPAPKSRRGRKR